MRSLERIPGWITPAAALLLGLVVGYWPTWSSGFNAVQTDVGDTRLQNYILEHSYLWIHDLGRDSARSFWSPPIFYPWPNAGAYTDVLLTVAPLYWIWRMLGFAPDTSYQLWLPTLSVCNFLAAFWLFRCVLRLQPAPSSIGAWLFAFASVRMSQHYHAQLVGQFYEMIAIGAFVRAMTNEPGGARRWILGCFLAIVAQLYGAFYVGWFFLFGLSIVGLWAVVHHETRPVLFQVLKSYPLTLLSCIALSVVLLYPMTRHYLQARTEVGPRSYGDAYPMIPRPQSWLYLGPENWVYGSTSRWKVFRDLPIEHEHRIGAGWLTALVALAWLAYDRRSWMRVLALSTVTLVVCVTLFPGHITLWKLIFAAIPGASAIRAVARIGTLVLIPFSFALAYFAESVLTGWKGRWALVVIAGCVIEQVQTTESFDKRLQRAEVATLARHVERTCGAFFYSPAGGQQKYDKYHLDAMWASLVTGIPTINGYSGNYPPGWNLFDPIVVEEVDRQRISRFIDQWSLARGLDRRSVCLIEYPVSDGPNAAFVSQQVPDAMARDRKHRVTITLHNTGATTWNAREGYRLRSVARGIWGPDRIELPHPVRAGQTVTFRFRVFAPARPGTYPFEWRMVSSDADWFGARTAPLTITVTP